MKRCIISIIIIAMVIFVWGCSDDDSNPIRSSQQVGVLDGYMFVENNKLSCSGIVYSIDGSPLNIDSMTVDGHQLQLDLREHICIYSVGNSILNSYRSGDSALMEIFTPKGTSSVKVALLEFEVDNPNILIWALEEPYDTVATQSEFTIYWNKNNRANYYRIFYNYYYDSAGVWSHKDNQVRTTDSSYTFLYNDVSYNGSLSIHVRSVTGPDIEDGGNIVGDAIKGTVTSFAEQYLYLYVGSGIGK